MDWDWECKTIRICLWTGRCHRRMRALDVNWGWERETVHTRLWTRHRLRWTGALDANWGQDCQVALARLAFFVFFVVALKDNAQAGAALT